MSARVSGVTIAATSSSIKTTDTAAKATTGMMARTRFAIATGMDDEKKTTGAPRSSSDTLGSLWQSALGQIDEIRDVIVKGSQAGKAKLDVQLLKRQRDRILAEIGALVVDEARKGAAVPVGCEDLAKRVDEIDTQIGEAEAEAAMMFGTKR